MTYSLEQLHADLILIGHGVALAALIFTVWCVLEFVA